MGNESIYRLYVGAMSRISGTKFTRSLNAMNVLARTPIRFFPGKDSSRYVVVDRSLGWRQVFSNERYGASAYARGIRARGRYLAESYFVDRVAFEEGDIVIDCGANVGDLQIWFKDQGLSIEYVGFEPSPEEFECLKENVRPGRAVNKGLWSEAGSMKFYVASGRADSSLIEPVAFDGVIEVQTVTLDSLVSEPVKLLKLEAEGAEIEVLRGAEAALEKIEYIAADLGFERGVGEEQTFVPVTNFLLQRGFELQEFSPSLMKALYRNVRVDG